MARRREQRPKTAATSSSALDEVEPTSATAAAAASDTGAEALPTASAAALEPAADRVLGAPSDLLGARALFRENGTWYAALICGDHGDDLVDLVFLHSPTYHATGATTSATFRGRVPRERPDESQARAWRPR